MTKPLISGTRPTRTPALTSRMPSRLRLCAVVLIYLAVLAGCTGDAPQEPAASPPEESPTPSAEPSPTSSATPEPSVVLVLGDPGDGQPIGIDAILAPVSVMAASNGLTVEQATDPTGIAAESVAAVIAFDQGAATVISAHYPGRPVLMITAGPTEDTGQSFFSLYFPDLALERQAMLAGYSAALITFDWRVAALSAPAEERLRQSILQGASYMCGLCRPTLPPYASYPLSFQTEPGAGADQVERVAAEMSQLGVATAVLSPSLLQPDIAAVLAENGIQVIGMGSPDGSAQGAWAATIEYSIEEALAGFWPSFIAGEPPVSNVIPLVISDRNPELFTDARLRLAEQAAEEISAGMISPLP